MESPRFSLVDQSVLYSLPALASTVIQELEAGLISSQNLGTLGRSTSLSPSTCCNRRIVYVLESTVVKELASGEVSASLAATARGAPVAPPLGVVRLSSDSNLQVLHKVVKALGCALIRDIQVECLVEPRFTNLDNYWFEALVGLAFESAAPSAADSQLSGSTALKEALRDLLERLDAGFQVGRIGDDLSAISSQRQRALHCLVTGRRAFSGLVKKLQNADVGGDFKLANCLGLQRYPGDSAVVFEEGFELELIVTDLAPTTTWSNLEASVALSGKEKFERYCDFDARLLHWGHQSGHLPAIENITFDP